MNVRYGMDIFDDRRALAAALASYVAGAAEVSSVARGRFCVALSGGSLMDMLAPALVAHSLRERIDWSTWQVFWVDERWVPLDSPDSNSGLARRLLLSRVDIPEEHIHPMNDAKTPDEAARTYEAKIRSILDVEAEAFPRFDSVLLGLGEDGHTASLFPGHPALLESRRWVMPVYDAPKPPPVRITLTLPVINYARRVVIVAAGTSKAGIVAEILRTAARRPDLPARMVNPTDGERYCFFDKDAAGI